MKKQNFVIKKSFIELNVKQKDEVLRAFEQDKTKVSFGDKIKRVIFSQN
ncbi:TPA: hypothetical protein VGT28_001509 [Campylobacter jejuni]|nr:hypothetical protein [Campylobacter jejuni]